MNAESSGSVRPKSLYLGRATTVPDRVICPECEKQEQKSEAFIMGSSRTLLGHTPHYDEDGVFVNDDPNKTTTSYKCSKGHTWQRTY